MDPASLETQLRGKFGELLREYGFVPTDAFAFVRKTDFGLNVLALGKRLSSSGSLCLSPGAGVRVDVVEELLRPESKRENWAPTFARPLYVLADNSIPHEWCFDDARQFDNVRSELSEALSAYALPFWDKYNNLPQLQRVLESDDPRDWFAMNAVERSATLAAVLAARGHRDVALARIEMELNDPQKILPKHRLPFERLKRAIASNDQAKPQ